MTRGYLSKWLIMTCKSLNDSTTNWTEFIPFFLILPIPNEFCIDSNNSKSFSWSLMIKTGKTLHLFFNLASGWIPIEKQPSASVKPVINQGFIIFLKFKIENDNLFNCLEGILTW